MCASLFGTRGMCILPDYTHALIHQVSRSRQSPRRGILLKLRSRRGAILHRRSLDNPPLHLVHCAMVFCKLYSHLGLRVYCSHTCTHSGIAEHSIAWHGMAWHSRAEQSTSQAARLWQLARNGGGGSELKQTTEKQNKPDPVTLVGQTRRTLACLSDIG